MPEYVCAVMKNHKKSFVSPQAQPPQCCGRPMAFIQDAPQPAACAQSTTAANVKPQALSMNAPSTIPQKQKEWWQFWK